MRRCGPQVSTGGLTLANEHLPGLHVPSATAWSARELHWGGRKQTRLTALRFAGSEQFRQR